MIPDIGLMIGAYIIVRMVSFLSRRDQGAESVLVKILAVITILVVLISVGDLLLGHPDLPRPSYP